MNCKPGDLAIVTRSLAQENIGRIVRVIKFRALGEMDEFKHSGEGWIVESVGSAPLAVTRGGIVVRHDMVRVFLDICLRPISGIPDTEDTTTEQPIKEIA